jgi:hypothetical protein
MPGVTSRAEIETELLDWMAEADWSPDEARFERLALALFAHQFQHCPPYASFCRARGATPETARDWREIPAVPAGAFKEMALRCFPAAATLKTFRTSGTSEQQRGELHLDTLALYEGSLLPTIRRHLFPDLPAGAKTAIRVLAPSAQEAPDSSLSHMFDCLLRELGSPASGHEVVEGELLASQLVSRLQRAEQGGEPLALCGSAFAFVHLLDGLERSGVYLSLAPGSRLMETGGFKGRSREMTRDALYAGLCERLGLEQTRIVNQYGMTELGSQFYDSVLSHPGQPRRKLGPPWARVRLLDPESGAEVRSGEPGMIAVHDLANTGSVAAVQTADLGCAAPDGFEVLGRAPGAEARGCSIAADLMLGTEP